MKGKLKKQNGEWIIRYTDGVNSYEYQLIEEQSVDFICNLFENNLVEFELVDNEQGNFVVSGGLIPVGEFGGKGLEYHYDKMAKIILPIKETWDTIFAKIEDEHYNVSGCGCGEFMSALEWLKENYNTPTKKEK